MYRPAEIFRNAEYAAYSRLQVVCPSEHVIFDWNLRPSDG